MATIVREARAPWWANLAVNVLGGLWNDYQQREQNKKLHALEGEIASAINGLAGGQQDNDGGLMGNAGSNFGAGLGSAGGMTGGNGWENAFHQSDNPLAEYDANMAGIAPTAQAAPVATITRRQPTAQEILNAFAGLMSSKRFRGVNPKAAQDLLTPYLTANENARAEQWRKELAEAYASAENDAAKLDVLYGGGIEGYVPQSILTSGQGRYQFDNPDLQPYSYNTGKKTFYGSRNPRTGQYIEAGSFTNELTPQQEVENARAAATLAENRRQFDLTLGDTREARNIAQKNLDRTFEADQNSVQSTILGDDGTLYIMRKNGKREKLDPNSVGLSTIERTKIDYHKGRIEELRKEYNNLLTAKAKLNKEQSGGVAEKFKEGGEGEQATPQMEEINQRLESIEKEVTTHENEISNILNSKMAGRYQARSAGTTSTGGYTFTGATTNGGQYADIINKHAKNYDVDPDLVAAIIQQESGGKKNAKSSAGAVGLMQLMPKTAKGLGVTDSYDPDQNIMGGTKYISQLLKKYGGDVRKALWAYNAGPGRVAQNYMPDEAKKYISRVLGIYESLKGQRKSAQAPVPQANSPAPDTTQNTTQAKSNGQPPDEPKYKDNTPQFRDKNGEILTKGSVEGLVWKAEHGMLTGITNREELYREFERKGITPYKEIGAISDWRPSTQRVINPFTGMLGSYNAPSSPNITTLGSSDITPTSPDITVLGSGDIAPTSPDVTPTWNGLYPTMVRERIGNGDQSNVVAVSPDQSPAPTYAEAVNHATSADIQQGLASLNGDDEYVHTGLEVENPFWTLAEWNASPWRYALYGVSPEHPDQAWS